MRSKANSFDTSFTSTFLWTVISNYIDLVSLVNVGKQNSTNSKTTKSTALCGVKDVTHLLFYGGCAY